MKTSTRALLGLILLCTVFTAYADVPNSFSSGQPARAAEVNENFEDLDTRVTANETAVQSLSAGQPQTFNASDYDLTAGLSKTLTNQNGDGSCDEWTMVSDGQGSSTVTYVDTSDGSTCYVLDITWNTNSSAIMADELAFTLNDGSRSVTVYDPPFPFVPETMTLGQPELVYYAGTITQYDSVGAITSTGSTEGYFVYTALGTHDVELPTGTLNDCLVLEEDRGSIVYLNWYCDTYGKVKTLQRTGNAPLANWEMTATD